jgi:hypothetical protein
MTQSGDGGEGLSYLGSEEKYRFMRDVEQRNMVVPLVGNFAGTKALRSVGTYLKDHGATVTAFYVSNVEQYLRSDGIWPQFCDNVAALPLDDASVFIRPNPAGGRGGFTTVTIVNGVVTSRTPPAVPSLGSPLGVMTEEVKECR